MYIWEKNVLGNIFPYLFPIFIYKEQCSLKVSAL